MAANLTALGDILTALVRATVTVGEDIDIGFGVGVVGVPLLVTRNSSPSSHDPPPVPDGLPCTFLGVLSRFFFRCLP